MPGRRAEKPWLVMAAALVVVAGCELLDPNPGPKAVDGTGTGFIDNAPPSLAKGAALYTANCERCHAGDASGTLIWPAPIWRFGGTGDIVRNGRDAMPAFPSLSDSQLVSIDLYLDSLGEAPTTSGSANFTTFCEGCHGALGAGGPFFPSSVQGYTPVTTLVRNGRGEMPAVIESRLSAEALDSLEAYIAGLADLSAYSGEEYYTARCAGCHGFAAEGPERGYQLRRPDNGYAAYIIREGRPGVQFPNTMPAYESQHLSDSQLAELLAFLDAFEQPTTGDQLYQVYCANCHGLDGRGGPTGSDLRSTLGNEAAFIDAVRTGNSGNRYWNRFGYMPRWTDSEISNADVQAIIAYLAGVING